MKYRVHGFELVRTTYEVEADNADEAYSKGTAMFGVADPVECERTGDFDDFVIVDPLLPSGEVDYDNVRHFGGV